MKLKEIINKLQLTVLTAEENTEAEVTGGYTSDLLSDVMANSQAGNVWITLQTHQNIIAVAKLKDLTGIIIVNNRTPDAETLKKASEENIPLMTTPEQAFTLSGKIYKMLHEKE
ncbi:MAG: serine kinase [Candidatus Aminicenantales bacterium]